MKKHCIAVLLAAALLPAAALAAPCDVAIDGNADEGLRHAAKMGEVQNVRCWLDKGANVNAADGKAGGWTALMSALLTR